MGSTRLNELRASGTVVIADTADFQDIAKFEPSEGTTNPSLIYNAVQSPNYKSLLAKTVAYIQRGPLADGLNLEECLSLAVEYINVQFGVEIFRLTGKVSTEVDVSLSFDTAETIAAALRILKMYDSEGVSKENVRIKISATWEGIQAAKILQKEHGVSCLVTVVFSLVQAAAAAEAGVDAIAPYVGRIADFGKFNGHQGDLGVERVSEIQNYLRTHGYRTKVMAASFRNTDQVRRLAGVDLLTAAPAILSKVEAEEREITPKLTKESANACNLEKMSFLENESKFRWAFNGDALAVEKSADAMRRFGDDTDKLKKLLSELLGN